MFEATSSASADRYQFIAKQALGIRPSRPPSSESLSLRLGDRSRDASPDPTPGRNQPGHRAFPSLTGWGGQWRTQRDARSEFQGARA